MAPLQTSRSLTAAGASSRTQVVRLAAVEAEALALRSREVGDARS
jgi:hypothetical protein